MNERSKRHIIEEIKGRSPHQRLPVVEVTEQGTKKRKGGHIKMIARKKPRKQSDVDSDDEHRKCLKIVTFEGTIDSEIMEKKSFIARLNKYSEITLEGIELILWGDLKIMMESSTEGNDQSDFWDDQQDWKIVTWRLYEACGVCILEFEEGFQLTLLHGEELASPGSNSSCCDAEEMRCKYKNAVKNCLDTILKSSIRRNLKLTSEVQEKKSFISKLDKVSSPEGDYLVIHRANGNFRAFNYLLEVLHIFDRQDLFHLYNLMMEQYSEIILEGFELILWRDLKIMMESSTEEYDQSDFWSDQQCNTPKIGSQRNVFPGALLHNTIAQVKTRKKESLVFSFSFLRPVEYPLLMEVGLLACSSSCKEYIRRY
ncbi:hypothetical protein Tco_0583902 [Tanacetum coccineum]